MEKGRIIKGIGGFYYVPFGDKIYECRARGIFRKNKMTPMVGDFVQFTITDEAAATGWIEAIEPRVSELIRPAVSNVNQAMVVFAVTRPEPNFSLLDRFLVLAEKNDLDSVIIMNKIDLLPGQSFEEIKQVYEQAGYPIYFTTREDPITISRLKELLTGKTTVFAGPSGVGKSTLLNLIQQHLILETGSISEKTERGKHTTRHVELIPLEAGGWVVDTPGFSSLNVDFMEAGELAHYYREFEAYVEACRFRTCVHEKEMDCGVKAALEAGKLSAMRYESYLSLLAEIRKTRRY